MKKQFNKYYISFFYICSTFVLYADPGTDNDTSDLETIDAPVPIDDYIWFLALIGLIYMFLKIKDFKNKEMHFNNLPVLKDQKSVSNNLKNIDSY